MLSSDLIDKHIKTGSDAAAPAWPAELESGEARNTSGFIPLDLRVLVLPDKVEEKSAGGIFLPEQAKEREKHATVKATLIAVGENAWAEASKTNGFVPPQPGQRVVIAKYGGILLTGTDGADYRIMNDEDIVARLVDDASA